MIFQKSQPIHTMIQLPSYSEQLLELSWDWLKLEVSILPILVTIHKNLIILEFHHFIELQIICVSSFWLIPIQGTFVTLVTTFHDTLILLIIGFLSVHKYMRNSSGGKGKDWGEISLA